MESEVCPHLPLLRFRAAFSCPRFREHELPFNCLRAVLAVCPWPLRISMVPVRDEVPAKLR